MTRHLVLTLTNGERTTTVAVERGLWSCHPDAGTIPTRRFKAALRRVGATSICEVRHDAAEVWAYHGGVFVGWVLA